MRITGEVEINNVAISGMGQMKPVTNLAELDEVRHLPRGVMC